MKRIIVLLSVLVLSVFMLSATVTSKVQRRIVVQGAYDSVTKVVFSPISTQSGSFALGMPFDIEGRLVQYGETENGREISKWSLVSNTKFKLKVKVGKLTYKKTDKDDTNSCELDYIIKFTYDFGYYDSSGTAQDLSGFFSVDTGENDGKGRSHYLDSSGTIKYGTPDDDGYFDIDIMPAVQKDSLVGTVEGSVYFMFTQAATNQIQKQADTVPSGDYEAQVIIKIEEKT